MKLVLIFAVLFQFFYMNNVNAMADNSSSAILIDANSEEILFDKNSEEKKYPASTTKIMTLILIYEAINNNQIAFEDMITTSSYAASMGGSQIYLKEGETMSVDDLLKSIIIASANDACVAFGEYLSGSIDQFVKEMNNKAKELKLKNTNFVNCTGLHDDNHYTCAYDLAIMSKHLLNVGAENLLKYTTLNEEYIRNGEFWLVNTNKLLSQSDYVNGLKTGYTKEAGYCLVSTATKNGQTMISVVLDEPKAKIRNEEALELINYGFSLYKEYPLFDANQTIETIQLPLTKEKEINLVTNDAIIISMKKEDTSTPSYTIQQIHHGSFNQGDHIANLVCERQTFPLYASNNATPLTWLERVYEVWLQLI